MLYSLSFQQATTRTCQAFWIQYKLLQRAYLMFFDRKLPLGTAFTLCLVDVSWQGMLKFLQKSMLFLPLEGLLWPIKGIQWHACVFGLCRFDPEDATVFIHDFYAIRKMTSNQLTKPGYVKFMFTPFSWLNYMGERTDVKANESDLFISGRDRGLLVKDYGVIVWVPTDDVYGRHATIMLSLTWADQLKWSFFLLTVLFAVSCFSQLKLALPDIP